MTWTSSAERCFSKSKGLTSLGIQLAAAMPVRLLSAGMQPIMQKGSLFPGNKTDNYSSQQAVTIIGEGMAF